MALFLAAAVTRQVLNDIGTACGKSIRCSNELHRMRFKARRAWQFRPRWVPWSKLGIITDLLCLLFEIDSPRRDDCSKEDDEYAKPEPRSRPEVSADLRLCRALCERPRRSSLEAARCRACASPTAATVSRLLFFFFVIVSPPCCNADGGRKPAATPGRTPPAVNDPSDRT